MKRTVLMWKADHAGCGWARIEMISKYLNKYYGDELETRTSNVMNPDEWVEKDKDGKIIGPKIHLTIHQRQYGTPNLQNFRVLQRNLKIPCIYEIDDYLHGVSRWSTAYQAYNPHTQKERFKNIDLYLKEANAVTVTTDYLKGLYSAYNGKIYVLPNCIDFDEVYTDEILKLREQHRSEHEKKNEIWIGWAGSNTHLPDLRIIIDAIKQILHDFPNVKLALGGWHGEFRNKEGEIVNPELNPWKDVPEDRIVKIPWAKDMKDYPKMLAQFDIGLAPLEDNDFNRAKSNIKLLEYGGCGVPVICSDVEPYTQTVTSGENGYRIKVKGSVHYRWYKRIKQLVEDREMRLKLGTNINKYVRDNFDIKKNIHLWRDAYVDIMDSFHK